MPATAATVEEQVMRTPLELSALLGIAVMTSSVSCVDRVIIEDDPLGGFASEEAMCQRYCEVLDTCGFYPWERCDLECNRPHEKWPWLTDECLALRRELFVCTASYDTCEEYSRPSNEGNSCLEERYNWEAAGYECFGQYLETDGWQGGSSSGG
jgi:hypothetical protein